MTSVKVGLALGGGGARGIAHIGVLRVLEAEGIPIHTIAGTSFGSIVGAMYAQNPSIESLYQRVIEFLKSDRFRRTKIFFIKRHYEEKKNRSFITNLKSYIQKGFFWGISLQRASFISEEDFSSQINLLLDDGLIEETTIPFVAAATDLTNGRQVSLSKGPIRKAVSASCAIPGVFPPIEVDGRELIDGGWVNQVPVEPLVDFGTDFKIGINISEENRSPQAFNGGLDIVLRAGEITRCVLSEMQLKMADLVIRPNMGDIHWSDFWRYEEAIQRGEDATKEAMKDLKHLLWKKRIRKFLKISP